MAVIKKNKKIVAGVLFGLALHNTVFAAVEEIKYQNENDGTKSFDIAINETDIENWNENKKYYGVYSSGNAAKTILQITGNNSVIFKDYAPAVTAYAGEAYGVYTEKGSQLRWDTGDSAKSITLSAFGNSAAAYGIYTMGIGSETNIDYKAEDGSELKNKQLNISVQATSMSKAGMSDTWSRNSEIQTAKVLVDNAASVYAQVVASEDDYANFSEYVAAVNAARAELNQKIAAYASAMETVISDKNQTTAAAITADDGAVNNIAAGSISAIARHENDTGASMNAAAVSSVASGVNTSNGAVNNITADDISAEASLKCEAGLDFGMSGVVINAEAAGINGTQDAVNNIILSGSTGTNVSVNAYVGSAQEIKDAVINSKAAGINGDHGAVNNIMMSGDIYTYVSANVSVNGEDGLINNAIINAEVAGINGDNGAVNNITVNNITSSANVYSNNSSGNESNFIGKILATGINSDNGAVNNIAVNNISLSGYSVFYENKVMLDEKIIIINADHGAVNNVKAVYLNAYAYGDPSSSDEGIKHNRVFGISGDHQAVNNITAENLTISSGSVYDLSECIGVNGLNAAINNVKLDALNVSMQGGYDNQVISNRNSAGISGDSGAINNVTVDRMEVSSNAYISAYGTTVLKEATVYVAGVVGNGYAVNNITADDIITSSHISGNADVDNKSTVQGAISGIRGTGGAVTNLHSATEDGALTIKTDLNISLGGEGEVASDVNLYGMYLDNASVNIYDNIDVQGTHVYSDGSSEQTETGAITYLNNASVNFAGYNDYYDHYYYDFDTKITGKATNGSGKFHKYESLGGQLELHGENTFSVNTDLATNQSDKLTFQTMTENSEGKNYVTIASDVSFTQDQTLLHVEGKTVVLEVTDNDWEAKGLDVNFDGKTSKIDTPLSSYLATPTVTTEANGSGRNVLITAIDFVEDGPSESMLQVGDSQQVLRNIGRIENSTMMQRMGELRNRKTGAEGSWLRITAGELGSGGSYGRSFEQDYKQIQLGYDKASDYNDGKLYMGAAISHLFGDVDYLNGSGKAKSTNFSLYASWLGQKGHYWDLVAKAGRMNNELNLLDANGTEVSGDYGTNTVAVSAEYGYRQNYQNGLFAEPQVQLTLGHIQSVGYRLSNGVDVRQSGIDSAVVRLGVLGGKELKNGNVYLKAAVLKDLGGKGSIAGYYGADSLDMEVAGNKAWYEIGLGTNIMLSKNNNFYFDALKTFGGNINQKWQVNAGLRWAF